MTTELKIKQAVSEAGASERHKQWSPYIINGGFVALPTRLPGCLFVPLPRLSVVQWPTNGVRLVWWLQHCHGRRWRGFCCRCWRHTHELGLLDPVANSPQALQAVRSLGAACDLSSRSSSLTLPCRSAPITASWPRLACKRRPRRCAKCCTLGYASSLRSPDR